MLERDCRLVYVANNMEPTQPVVEQVAVKPKATRTRKPKAEVVVVVADGAAEQPVAEAVTPKENSPKENSPKENSPKEKAPRKKPVKVEKVAVFDFVGHAAQRYTEGGWVVFKCQPGSVNDLVAHRDKKLHYIRVVPSNNAEDARFTGEQKNAFIQNAFSNAALPVFARVKPVSKKGDVTPSSSVITFENINDGARVIVGAAVKK